MGYSNIKRLGGIDVVSNNLTQQANSTLNRKAQIVYSQNALGGGTAYYLDSSGNVWAWGENSCGQLGNGDENLNLIGPSGAVQVLGFLQ